MKRKQVVLVGCFAVLVTMILCGMILFRTWARENEKKEPAIEEIIVEEKDDAAIPIVETEVTPTIEEQKVFQPLIVESDPELYTYEDLESDVRQLEEMYPEWITVNVLGETQDGRALFHVVIGDASAQNKIFVNACIHGREYMTSQLVMKQMVSFVKHMVNADSYQQYAYQELMNDTAIHVMPLVNPDGAAISQGGLEALQTERAKEMVASIANMDGQDASGTYLRRWKANVNGVDLNRNFDALWSEFSGTSHPSSERYKGTSVGCEAESAVMIALTEQEQFKRTISYHTQGSVIYWYFAQEGQLYEDTLAFANRISSLTGYPMDANYEYLDPAGYKDWAISKCGIPSLTVEVGRDSSPVAYEQFQEIWQRNEFVWEETLINMYYDE